jgi:hypothetical protein
MPTSQGALLFEGPLPGAGDHWFSGPPAGHDWRIRCVFISKNTAPPSFIEVGIGPPGSAVAFVNNLIDTSSPTQYSPVNIYVPDGHQIYTYCASMAPSPRIYISGEVISFP